MSNDEEFRHGIQAGAYDYTLGYPACVLECPCGAEFWSGSWAEAGAMLDEHLEKAS
jgi:hypothetical protein